jgi:hypothetical protein
VYEVRLKATESDFAGQTATVTIGPVEFFEFSVETTDEDKTFSLPTSGYLSNPATTKTYDWDIDWGDGTAKQNASGSSATDSPGISHTYAAAGTYQITISPHGSDPASKDAWFGAFGFAAGTSGANSPTNKNKVVSVDSPISPLMTRTQEQIDLSQAPNYEWVYTFYGCQNAAFTMGEDFRFSDEWDSITKAGNYFAYAMFSGCSGAEFTMSEVFNLPQGITTVGSNFAFGMFYRCSGAGFTMNDDFNLPQGITTAGESFASDMFRGCSGTGFLVNGVFKFPKLDDIPSYAFAYTFNLGTNAKLQAKTTATSIINGNDPPDSDRNTFSPAAAWSDYSSIPANWRQ